jgi:hypothetical protein
LGGPAIVPVPFFLGRSLTASILVKRDTSHPEITGYKGLIAKLGDDINTA